MQQCEDCSSNWLCPLNKATDTANAHNMYLDVAIFATITIPLQKRAHGQ